MAKRHRFTFLIISLALTWIVILTLASCSALGSIFCSHTDADEDGFCDSCSAALEKTEEPSSDEGVREGEGEAALTLISGGVPGFNIVYGNDTAPSLYAVIGLVNKINSCLEGGSVQMMHENSADVSEVEILVGSVTSRGERYKRDKYSLGYEGYIIERVDTKLLVLGGSDEALEEALSVLEEEIFGIEVGKTIRELSVKDGIMRPQTDFSIKCNSVSFTINQGEFVAIMGPSGCGKSTLLNVLGLLDNPTGGSYQLLDTEMSQLREKDRTKFRKGNIGFVFQSFNLIDELNVYENVELPLKYLNISASERKARVTAMLKRMNISHRAQHYPQQLSGGQQQRVAIARAVVANPKLILADEPTGNLDSRNGKEVMDLLCELNKEGTTIVMVTHSQKDASVAQRIINLFDGEIVADVRNEL